MKYFLLILTTLLISVAAPACGAQMKLPDKMPDDMLICLSDYKEHRTVCVDRESLKITDGYGWHNRRKRKVVIASREAEGIYQTLIENSFDQMKNDSGTTDNNVNRSISIYSNAINLAVNQGILPLSTVDQSRFERIRQAILDLAANRDQNE